MLAHPPLVCGPLRQASPATSSGEPYSRALRSLVKVPDAPPAFIRHWRRQAPVPEGEASLTLWVLGRFGSGGGVFFGLRGLPGLRRGYEREPVTPRAPKPHMGPGTKAPTLKGLRRAKAKNASGDAAGGSVNGSAREGKFQIMTYKNVPRIRMAVRPGNGGILFLCG